MKELLGLALLGVGGYWLAQKFGLFNATASFPGTPSSTPNPSVTNPPPTTTPPNAAQPLPPTGLTATQLQRMAVACQQSGGRWDGIGQACIPNLTGTPAPPVIVNAVTSAWQLINELNAQAQAAGLPSQLNVDQWNYLLVQKHPNAIVNDLGLRDASGNTPVMDATQYVQDRMQVLSPAGQVATSLGLGAVRTMVHANRRNYVRRYRRIA